MHIHTPWTIDPLQYETDKKVDYPDPINKENYKEKQEKKKKKKSRNARKRALK